MPPILTDRFEGGARVPVLVWRLGEPVLAISSGPLGGGIGVRSWVLNATVPMSYDRHDPDVHLSEIAASLGLNGSGVGLMTGVDVAERISATDGGVQSVVTVGLGAPAWAAAPDGDLRRVAPGTINSVIRVPVRLSEAALVNAVVSATEAKAQALWDAGVDATGTASDATVVICPLHGVPEPFGGPRSTWGARLARTVHAATLQGAQSWARAGKVWRE